MTRRKSICPGDSTIIREQLLTCGPKSAAFDWIMESVRICVAFTRRPGGTVNAVISKRFAKKQQIQWSKRGTHLLLQDKNPCWNPSITLSGLVARNAQRNYK